MTSPEQDQPAVQDHGKVVKSHSALLSWTWLFPLLASAVAVWFFWENWKSEGPKIEIRFASAPGIQPDKTVVTFRGVTAGKVTDVQLDPTLKDVVVHVRLNAFAKGLAREKTDFWIDQPEISLKGATGITALIQGNSIQARVRGGSYATHFRGLDTPPLVTTEIPGLIAYLTAPSIWFLERGTPIYYHGVLVGMVGDKKVGENGQATLLIGFTEEASKLINSHSRFWVLPATSLDISPRGAHVNIAGVKALLEGGIAFDQFSPGGETATNSSCFTLSPNEAAARAEGPPLHLSLPDAHGLIPGETRICYLGQPIGLLESVQSDPASGMVDAIVHLEAAYTNFAQSDTLFTLIAPSVTPHGVHGLDTLVTGAYIACEPGASGALADHFIARTTDRIQSAKSLRVFLAAEQLPALSQGSPVYYHGLQAGVVVNTGLNAQKHPQMEIAIDPAFRKALHANSRFWRVPATSISAASGVLSVEVQGLASLIDGGIAFDTFGAVQGEPAEASTYPLFDNEKLASATSTPIHISFANGRGLLPGKTEIRYLGVPVGIIESVHPLPGGKVETTARLQPGYDFLCRSGSIFYMAHPNVSLNGGLKGIETIVSGIYIECIQGQGAWADTFVGSIDPDSQLLDNNGCEIKLTSASTSINPGALVMYRETRVGEVAAKTLSKDGHHVLLTLAIQPEYRHLITDQSCFWDNSEALLKIGFLKVRLRAPILTSINGRIAFMTPDVSAPPSKQSRVFELQHDNPNP